MILEAALVMIVVPNRRDFAWNLTMSPRIPPGKPGEFSTADRQDIEMAEGVDEEGHIPSVVVVS